MSIIFYILDVESSGLSAAYHEMHELSIIRCHDRVQLTEHIKCEMPERASLDALKVCGKSFNDLLKGKSKEEVVEKANKFFASDGATPAHRCIVAHNASFDRRFTAALWEKVGEKFPCDLWIDTIPMMKLYAKNIGLVKPKVNLAASCDMLGIKKTGSAHASKSDTRNTYFLWKKLTEEKGMDYLPFIKTLPHVIKKSDYFEPDLSIFDDLEDDDMPF